jgi:hypothetical protein
VQRKAVDVRLAPAEQRRERLGPALRNARKQGVVALLIEIQGHRLPSSTLSLDIRS